MNIMGKYNFQWMSAKKIATFGSLITGVLLLIDFYIYPFTFDMLMKYKLELVPGSYMRKMYTDLPFPLISKVYLFNVTNPHEVQNGAIPEVNEVGPFVFYKYIRRREFVDNDEDDTIEYNLYNTYHFQQDLSGNLTGNEQITIPNPVLVSMALGVNVDREPMLELIANAISIIFNNPTDIFWTGRVMDILFDGMDLDCSSEDFNSKAVCTVFEGGEEKQITPHAEKAKFFKFSFFGSNNNTPAGPYKVLRGSKNISDVGQIVEYQGEREIDIWETDSHCNAIRGTDGTIFAPFQNAENGFWVFEPAICRGVFLYWTGGKNWYRMIPTLHFTWSISNIKYADEDSCFCRSESHCPKKGTFDLFPCLGVPLIGSHPHFWNADEEIFQNIKGLHPDPKKHSIDVNMEIRSGIPMSGTKRAMVSYELVPISKIPIMSNLHESYLPMFWVEEGVDLPTKFVNMLRLQMFPGIIFAAIMKYFLTVIAGVSTIVSAGVVLYRKGVAEGIFPFTSGNTSKLGPNSSASISQVKEMQPE